MTLPLKIATGVGGLAFLGFLAWGLIARRRSWPCPSWLGWMVELDNPFTATNRAATIIRHLELKPGMTVLDLGCGPGRLTIPLAQAVGPEGVVVALDLQPAMLRRVQVKAEAAGLTNLQFLEAGLGAGRLACPPADRAVLVTVLGEIPNPEAALHEIFEVLRPGGVLSITEVIFDPHFQRRAVVQRLAARVGFHESGFFGNSLAYTLHLEKPFGG